MKSNRTLKRFLTSFAIITLISISYYSIPKSGGADAKYSGAPGDLGNCTNCHTGTAIDSGSNWNNITLNGTFHGGGYLPDSTYAVTISHSQSGIARFGFQATCLDASDSMAGSFTVTSGKTRKVTGTVAGSSRDYIGHSNSGTSGSGSNSWTFNWTAPSSNLDSVTCYVAVNASNNNNGTSGDMIFLKTFNIGPSSWIPTAVVSASTTTPCSGVAVQLTGSSSDSNATYSWNLPGGNPSSSTAQNPSVTYQIGGPKYAILSTSNAYGTSVADTLTLQVTSTPTALIIGNDRSMCEGDSVQLIAAYDPTATYLWSHGASGSNSVFVKDTGSYTVTVSKSGCSASSNAIQVSFLSKPSVSLSSNVQSQGDSSCTDSEIILLATGTADSFLYYSEGQLLGSTSATSWNTFFANETTYGVRAKGSNGCFSDTSQYTVYEVERLVAPEMTCQIISTQAVAFQWLSTLYHHGFQISLDSGDNWSDPSSGSTGTSHEVGGLDPYESVQLWIRALDQAPCLYSEVGTKVCKSDSCSPFDLTIAYDQEVCDGEASDVVIHGLRDEHFAFDFESNGPFHDTLFSFTPTVSKNYVLRLTDSANLACPVQEVLLPVTVIKLAEIELTTDNPNAVYCQGDQVMLSVADSFDQVDFYHNGILVQSGVSMSWTGNAAFKYDDSLWVVVHKGMCLDTSDKVYLSILNKPNAAFSSVRLGPNVTFTPEDQDHAEYNWDFGDGDQSTDVIPIHNYSTSEGSNVVVCLEVKDDEGCVADTCLDLSIPDMSSLAVLKELGIQVYPNPVEEVLIIDHIQGPMHASILDIHGAVVMMGSIDGRTVWDVSSLTSGIYILRLTLENQYIDFRLFKD